MTQSSGGTVKAPRLRRLSDQTALMVKGTSPELWRVLSFKDSINWLRNVLYGDMLYYRILWGNAIQEIWCPVELVRRHARGASPTKLRFSAIATDRRGILPSVCLQTPARLRKGLVCIRDFLSAKHGSADSFATFFSSIVLCLHCAGWALPGVRQGYEDIITLAKCLCLQDTVFRSWISHVGGFVEQNIKQF